MKKIISIFSAIIMVISILPTAFAANSHLDNLIVTNNQTSVMLSWKNPVSGTIDNIQILDESGSEVIPAAAPSKENGKYVNATVNELTIGQDYTYTVKVNMQNGNVFEDSVSFHAGVNYQWDAQNGVKMFDLAKLKIEQGDSLLPFYVEITQEAAHSGNSGLHAISNSLGWVNLKFEGISLDSSKKYRASVWAKARNISREVWLCSDNSGKAIIQNNGDWKRYSFDISGTGYFIMNLQSAMSAFSDLYADDFAVYELDASGNEIGDNLLANGGFEHTVYDYVIADGKVTWKEPGNSSYSGVDIYYRDIEGNETKLNDKKIEKRTTEFVLPESCLSDESYDLLFVSYMNENTTPAITYSVVGKADYYKAVAKQGGNVVTSLVPGNVTVSRFVKNNAMGSDYSVTLMLGLYKDDELVRIQYKGATVPQNGVKTEISDNITIPDDGTKYEVRAFLWDSPTGMNILKEFDTFKMN